MTRLKTPLSVISFLLICLFASWSFALPAENVQVSLVALDPHVSSTLGSNELLYVRVDYTSDIPLRFQAIAMRDGMPLEVGATRNPAYLHAPGSSEALTWVGYTNPTHIDAVAVIVSDEEWRELHRVTKEADVTWREGPSENPREPAEWVESLIKSEKRKMDFVYDPEPQKHGALYDILFFLTIVSIPAYVLLQLHMLWHYRYRWRELAFIPLFPYLIVAFYAIVGLEIETALQVTFLFRYTPLALFYLVCLWLARRLWQKKLPPPKLYKPPQV